MADLAPISLLAESTTTVQGLLLEPILRALSAWILLSVAEPGDVLRLMGGVLKRVLTRDLVGPIQGVLLELEVPVELLTTFFSTLLVVVLQCFVLVLSDSAVRLTHDGLFLRYVLSFV